MTAEFSDIIRQAADDEALAARMAEFYRRVDEAVAAHQPVCLNRGACCRFDQFGHRLYVTTPELGYFLRGQQVAWRSTHAAEGACPWQAGGMCTAREHRPLGCRIYFCDAGAQAWQGPEYERFLGELKLIGRESGLPYAYREWLSALDELAPGTAPQTCIDRYRLPVIQ